MKLDLVILDYASLDLSVLEGLILIKKLIPNVNVVVLIIEQDEDFIYSDCPSRNGLVFQLMKLITT